MSQRERRAEQGAITALRPVTESPETGSRASPSLVPISPAAKNFPPIPNAADRDCVLGLAREHGFLPAPPAPRVPIAPADDFRAWLASIRNPNGQSARVALPFVEPPDLFDPALDGAQQDAVARALQTPDGLLIQGLPGTGKTRVVAEIVRQAVRRGQRVLLLANGGAAVDAVLSRLQPTVGLAAVRLLARDERIEELPPGSTELTSVAQEGARRAQLLRQAAEAQRDAEARLHSLAEAATAWNQLLSLAGRRHERAAERTEIGQRRERLADEEPRLAETAGDDDPLAVSLRQTAQNQAERLARLQAEQLELIGEGRRLAAERRDARARRDALRPLEEARQSRRFLSLRFWQSRFRKSLPTQVTAARERLESVEQALNNLRLREEGLDQSRRQFEDETVAERARLVDAEIVRRRQELDEAEQRLQSNDRDEEEQFGHWRQALPAGLAIPSERTDAAVQSAHAVWEKCLREAERQADFTRRWRELVELDGDALVQQWRGTFNVVAGPLAALAAEPAHLTGPFDLLIALEAHLLAEAELVPVAQKARSWVLAGEPSRSLRTLSDSRTPVRSAPVHRGWPAPDFFAGLWDLLHHETWVREGDRLIYRMYPAPEAKRRGLEIEAVADRPEIELRILPNGGDPVLAEVAFPALTSLTEAREYLFKELGEVPCQPCSRLAAWSASELGQTLHVNPADVGSPPHRAMSLGNGVSLRTHEPGAGRESDEFMFFFSAADGWDRPKAEAWVAGSLLKRDSGRACRLEKNYRQTPALTAWLNEAVVCGARYAGEHRSDGAVQFEPSPRRAPSSPRRGGAGYEIDLADPRQRELLPNDLAALLPARGFVNLPEAQAIADLMPRFPLDHSVAITAPYAAQALVLRHYLSGDSRVVLPGELARRDCDLLVVGLTRSHVSRAVTYGDDPAALIHLFTRPRCRLIFVGDPGTLARRAQWEGAIDHLDAAAGERERRWVNALIRFLPTHGPQHARTPQRVKA